LHAIKEKETKRMKKGEGEIDKRDKPTIKIFGNLL